MKAFLIFVYVINFLVKTDVLFLCHFLLLNESILFFVYGIDFFIKTDVLFMFFLIFEWKYFYSTFYDIIFWFF